MHINQEESPERGSYLRNAAIVRLTDRSRTHAVVQTFFYARRLVWSEYSMYSETVQRSHPYWKQQLTSEESRSEDPQEDEAGCCIQKPGTSAARRWQQRENPTLWSRHQKQRLVRQNDLDRSQQRLFTLVVVSSEGTVRGRTWLQPTVHSSSIFHKHGLPFLSLSTRKTFPAAGSRKGTK